MFLRILSYVYIFLVRLRFSPEKSVADVIRKRYDNDTLVKVRKFEKHDLRCKKTSLDISFIETCLESDLIPNFVCFRTANKKLKNSHTYDKCHKLLLSEELSNKKERHDFHLSELNKLKFDLYNTLSRLDFLYVTSLFLERNARLIEDIRLAQNIKLTKLKSETLKHNANDQIFNYSSHTLTKAQESLLMKGLNYALPPKRLKYEDYYLNFELFFRSVNSTKACPDKELDNFKVDLRRLAHTSFSYYNGKKKKLENISEEEHRALIELISLDSIIIQKADKGNVIVLLDKDCYINKMNDILSDPSKFKSVIFNNEYDDVKYILGKEQ